MFRIHFPQSRNISTSRNSGWDPARGRAAGCAFIISQTFFFLSFFEKGETEACHSRSLFFSGALQAIEDTANLKQEEDQLRSEEARTRTELEAEEKKLKADIDRSIKERLNEINRTYDGEISKAKDELKKAQAKREKARNQSVKARIAEETKGPLDEAAEKLRNMKEAFRKQHMPAFTTTRLYYSLFMPHRFKDFLLLVFLIVICFIAVPCAVYFLAVPEKWQIPVVMAGIYVAAILLFGGIYIGISNATKTPPGHMEMLRMGRDTWDEIRADREADRTEHRERDG